MKFVQNHMRLSPYDLAAGVRCRHLVELEHQVALGSRGRPEHNDPIANALRRHALEHKTAYLAYLRTRYEVAVVGDDLPESAALERTNDAIAAGYEVIYRPYFLDRTRRWSGRADFLRKNERPSKLGGYSYEVMDASLANDTRASTLLQLCLFADLLQEIQGDFPERVYVVTPAAGFTEVGYRTMEYLACYRQVRAELPQMLKAEVLSYPEPVAHCGACNWQQQCADRRRADDHLSLVAGITHLQRSELEANGIHTLEGLAKAPSPLPFRAARSSAESLRRAQAQAKVQWRGRKSANTLYKLLRPMEEGRGLTQLPEPDPGDLVLEIEGDTFVGRRGMEYLFGWLYGDGTEWRYQHMWAQDPAEERSAYQRFIDFALERAERDPGMHIYHFGANAPSALKRLAGQYGTRIDALDELLRGRRFVDVRRIVRQSLVASVEHYSRANIESLFSYARASTPFDDRRHKRAIQGLLQLGVHELPQESRQNVTRSNEDDCRSTIALRSWLETQRGQVIADGESVPRPTLREGQPGERLGEWLQGIQTIENALLSGLPDAERNEDEQAKWLLAHLLRWHHREDKSVFWERFRLRSLDAEDLMHERRAVAGLQYEREIDKSEYNPRMRSRVHRYAVPPQELEIRPKHTLLLASDATERFGEVLSVDPSGAWMDVKTPKTFDPTAAERAAGAFVDEFVSSKAVAASNERIATRAVETNGDIARADPLAAKLLRREPMAGLARAVAEPWEIVDHLAGDVLPVQGPPGAGKTFLGARMILRLCLAGKRVGVTANSHAVINNLLRAVHKAAESLGVRPLVLVHKASAGKAEPGGGVSVETNGAGLIDELRIGEIDVLGGTAWLWSAESSANAVDTLFVDEAGQMSLANVLACTPSARNLVLLGDPQQLTQPTQATHPEGTEVSALQHLIGADRTMPAHRGLFLPQSYRMHPAVCAYISEQFYEGKLASAPKRERQCITGVRDLGKTGLTYLPISHTGNANSCTEEVAAVTALVRRLLARGRSTDEEGASRKIGPEDVLVLAPFNAQVHLLQTALASEGGVQVGTVDRFQGREAPVVIYSCTSSSVEDAPRGMEFLFDPHRLNVAISRAKALAIIVCSPALLMPTVRSPRQMRLANILARYVELAQRLPSSALAAKPASTPGSTQRKAGSKKNSRLKESQPKRSAAGRKKAK